MTSTSQDFDTQLSQAPISKIKLSLDRIFGLNEWVELENVVIGDHLGLILTPLLLDKINLLKALAHVPDEFWENPLFMLHAVAVINNRVGDFDSVPHITSLELIYAIVEIVSIIGLPTDDQIEVVNEVVSYILREEGFSSTPPQISFLNLKLEPGQAVEDIASKNAAIKTYILHMTSL